MALWLFPLMLSDASEIGIPCLVVVSSLHFTLFLWPLPSPFPVSMALSLASWLLPSPHSAPLCLIVLCGLSVYHLLSVRHLPTPWVMLSCLPLSLRNSEEEWSLRISGQSPCLPRMLHTQSALRGGQEL